jgi:hypothetical protein
LVGWDFKTDIEMILETRDMLDDSSFTLQQQQQQCFSLSVLLFLALPQLPSSVY